MLIVLCCVLSSLVEVGVDGCPFGLHFLFRACSQLFLDVKAQLNLNTNFWR